MRIADTATEHVQSGDAIGNALNILVIPNDGVVDVDRDGRWHRV